MTWAPQGLDPGSTNLQALLGHTPISDAAPPVYAQFTNGGQLRTSSHSHTAQHSTAHNGQTRILRTTHVLCVPIVTGHPVLSSQHAVKIHDDISNENQGCATITGWHPGGGSRVLGPYMGGVRGGHKHPAMGLGSINWGFQNCPPPHPPM